MKVHDDQELGPKAPIAATVTSVALVTLLLSIYGARSVADQVATWERVRQIPGVESVVDGLVVTQTVLGLESLHLVLEAARHQINEAYLIARKVEEPVDPTPIDPPIVEAPDESHPAHRRGPPKHRVLVIGASSIQFALGVELERRFPMYEKVKVKRFGQLATSLARPDFFDWPKKAAALIEEFKPDLIVTNYGGNDAQDILLPDGSKVPYDSADWEPAFKKLVVDLIELGRRHGADTVMIGMPIMREDKFTAKMKRLNRAMKEATEGAGALYISTWELSGNAKGEYLTSARYKGKRGLLRTSDGVHYSKLGAEMVVDAALEIIERRYGFVPSDPSLGPAEPHAFESKALGRWVSYVAYRPRVTAAPAVEVPRIVLRPGSSAGLGPPGDHPHRLLQTLAEREAVNLVLLEAVEPDAAVRDAFEVELTADLERHFPAGDGVRTLSVTEAWKTELEPAITAFTSELKAATP